MKDDSQLDIPDRQNLTVDTPHHEREWTEIGRAEVTENIFGRAKVRIIRAHDTTRRAWAWVGAAALVATALVVALLNGKDAAQTDQAAQSAKPGLRSGTGSATTTPTARVEPVPATAAPVTVKSDHGTPPRGAGNYPAVSQKSASQQSAYAKSGGQVAPQPVLASKPGVTPTTTGNAAAGTRTVTRPAQPPTVNPSAANKPVIDAASVAHKESPTLPLPVDNQLADPINVQGK